MVWNAPKADRVPLSPQEFLEEAFRKAKEFVADDGSLRENSRKALADWDIDA